MMNTWTPETVATMLSKYPKAVERAIVAIYQLQTTDERAGAQTRYSNSVGFSAFDARFGTWMAREILAGKPLRTRTMQEKAAKLALKYRRQLADLANASGKPVPVALGGCAVHPDHDDHVAIRAEEERERRDAAGREVDMEIERERQAERDRRWCGDCQSMKCPDGCCCGC